MTLKSKRGLRERGRKNIGDLGRQVDVDSTAKIDYLGFSAKSVCVKIKRRLHMDETSTSFRTLGRELPNPIELSCLEMKYRIDT